MAIKNKTYRNLMIVINKIQKKGYDFDEAERMARLIFDEFEARPLGMSIEEWVNRILPKEEYEKEYAL